ncbi:MAG: nucleotidyltransferase family protein [Crocosphaera sp.]|nr:nucleotidyltransferase family protein [Crocosphaera sp.]
MNQESRIAMMILAAGASTRMGTPKQLLSYQGLSLLGKTIKTALSSVCQPIVVVLGAYEQQIKAEVELSDVSIVENPNWHLGMGATIAQGMLFILSSFQGIDAVIISVCDQPFLSTEIINNLVTSYHSTGKPIIACQYADTLGVPALFNHRFFEELTLMKETAGAKQLIKTYKNQVFSIPFVSGAIDIDTPEEYQKLLGL